MNKTTWVKAWTFSLDKRERETCIIIIICLENSKTKARPLKKLQSLQYSLLKGRSRINTDWFPKWASRRGPGATPSPTPLINVFDFNSLKYPFPGFLSNSDMILACFILLRWSLATWEVISLLKIILSVMTNLTNFQKMVETGVDPCNF